MDINTSQGFLDAVKQAIAEQLAKTPMLGQLNIGSADNPVYLKDGLITETGSVVVVSAATSSNNGYVRFSNGIISQWGNTNYPSDTAVTVTFPIAFSSRPALALSCGDRENRLYEIDTTYFTCDTTATSSAGLRWIAVGT